jgi:hypothetical protein
MTAYPFSLEFQRSLRHLATLQERQNLHMEVLYYLAAEGGAVPRDELVTVLKGLENAPDATNMLSSMQKAGLIRNRRQQSAGKAMPVISLEEDLEGLLQLPPFYRRRLRARLGSRDLAELKRMSEGFYATSSRPVDPESRNPVDFLASFKAMILDRDALAAAVEEHISLPGRILIKVLAMFPDGLTLRDLRKHVGYFGQKLDSEELKRELIHLHRDSGFVMTSGGDTLLKHDQYFPSETRIMLVQDIVNMVRSNFTLSAPPLQIYPSFAGRLQPESWKVRFEESMLFHNAQVILIYLISHRVTQIQKGGVHKTEIKRISAMFQPPQEDHQQFHYLFDYFEQHGVVQVKNEVWAVNMARAAEFFREPCASFRQLLRDFFGADPTDEEELSMRIEHPDSGVLDPVRVLWLLKHVSPKAWITEEELAHLYARSEGGYRGDQHRAGIERFISHLLQRGLFWFGLVELSQRAEEGGLIFRLSARGKALLQDNEEDLSLSRLFLAEEKLLVQANLEVYLPKRLPPARTLFLSRFADYERGKFRINSQSLSRGLDSGLDLERIRGFFVEHSAQEIPQNVDYLLEEVSSRHGHILVDPQLMVLKTEDERLMQELSLMPALRKDWLALYQPCLMLLSASTRVPRVVEDLRRMGYMPRVRWDAVIDEGQEQLELSQEEKTGILAMLKAYEYADRVHPELGELLRLVDGQISEEDRGQSRAVPQRKLGASYEALERMSTSIATGKL